MLRRLDSIADVVAVAIKEDGRHRDRMAASLRASEADVNSGRG